MRNSYIVILIVTFGRTYMQMLHQCGKVTTQGAVDISVEPQNGPGAWRAGPVLLLFYRNAAKPLSSPFFLYGGGSLRHIRAVFLSVPEETERQPGPAGRKVRAECRPGFRKAQPGKPKGHCLPQLTEVRHVQALFSGIAHDIPQIQIKRLFKIARRRRTDAVLRRKQRMAGKTERGIMQAERFEILPGLQLQSTNEELYSVLSAGLSAAMSGIPFWGFDIAGFAGSLPTLDLYRRSTMFACFCPIMQWHSEPDGGQFRELMPGGEGNNERSPWNLAKAWNMPSFIDEMRFWHRLRMNLLPYLYAAALDCAAQNRPMMRPLVYLWPEDGEAIAAEDEYLLGDSLLVAPLLEENQMERTVYLPEGNWYGLFDRRRYSGKRRLASSRGQPFPVYLREGFALPLFLDGGTALGCDVGNSSAAGRPLHFLLAGPKGEGHFLDEGANDFTFKWEAGEVRVTGKKTSPLTWEILSAAE